MNHETKISNRYKIKSVKSIDNEYKKWFSSELKKWHFSKASSSYPIFEDFVNNCCCFMTMTFPQGLLSRRKLAYSVKSDDYSLEFDCFHLMYVYIAKKLLGKHYNRKCHVNRLPFVITSMDFEGSRYATSSTLGRKNPHIHALWALTPELTGKFWEVINSADFRLRFLNHLPSDNVKFEKFTQSRNSISSTATYVAKSHIKISGLGNTQNLLRIYPNSNYNGSGVKYTLSRKYGKIRSPFDGIKINHSLTRTRRVARIAREHFTPWDQIEAVDSWAILAK